MGAENKREPPRLRRVEKAESRVRAIADRDDPKRLADQNARTAFGGGEPSPKDDDADPQAERAEPPLARSALLLGPTAENEAADGTLAPQNTDFRAQLLAENPSLEFLSREERARRFLSDYEFCGSLLDLSARFDRLDAFLGQEPSEWAKSRASYWRSRRASIASLVSGLRPSREKVLLTLRYLEGFPIERVAERMSVSRRTAYRIHARALSLVAAVLERKR